MSTLYDHISATSKTAFRKVLRTTLEEQFAKTAPLIDALCKDMCAETIYPGHCLARYKDVERILRDIEVNFANYSESRKCAIGVDSDGDIAFMKDLLAEYKLKITQLKKGIEERLTHVQYFDPERPEKRKTINALESFLSSNKDIEMLLTALQKQYDELAQEIYGPQDDKVVLKRFNRHFFDVAQSNESAWQKAFSLSSDKLFIVADKVLSTQKTSEKYSYTENSLWYRIYGHMIAPQKDIQAIHCDQIELFKPLFDLFEGNLAELISNPQALARNINDRQLPNEQVEDFMTRAYLWQRLDDLKDSPSKSHIANHQRGRPPEDSFYEGFMDLDNLKEFMHEDFQEQYHTPIKEDVKHGGKNSHYFLCALLVAINLPCTDRVRGRVTCFYHYLQGVFGKIGRTLRSFQKYIDGFLEFLQSTVTTVVDIFAKPKLKERKFHIGKDILCHIVSKLSFRRLQKAFT